MEIKMLRQAEIKRKFLLLEQLMKLLQLVLQPYTMKRRQDNLLQIKNEWYHGWKQANDLTRQMYPLFKEYIKTGKPFDDAFADRLSRAIKIDRLKNNETNLSKENKSSIAELRGLSTPTKVPYKAQIISKEKLQGLHYTYNSKLER